MEPAARRLDRVPPGYRGLGRFIRTSQSGKAQLFEYYGNELWIPSKRVVQAEGGYWAPDWAITSAKRWRDENRH